MQNIKGTDLPIIFEFSQNHALVLIHLSPEGHVMQINRLAEQQYPFLTSGIDAHLIDACERYGLLSPVVSWESGKPVTQNTPVLSERNQYVEWQCFPIKQENESVSWLLTGKLRHYFMQGSALDQFCQALGQLPCFVYMKSLDKVYRYSNDTLIRSYGFNPSGIADDDAPWASGAKQFQANDALALKQGKIVKRECSIKDGAPLHTLSMKVPIRNAQGKTEGLLGISTPCTAQENAQLSSLQGWLDDQVSQHINLSLSEMRCLTLAAEGKSAAEIGRRLAISKRTVEAHFNHAKLKTGCAKQFQLGYWVGKQASLLAQ